MSTSSGVVPNYTLKQYWRKFLQTRKTEANAKKNLFVLIAEEKRKNRTLSKTSLEDGFVITTSNNLLAPNDDAHVIISRHDKLPGPATSQSNTGVAATGSSSNAASRFFTRLANSLRSIAPSLGSSSHQMHQHQQQQQQQQQQNKHASKQQDQQLYDITEGAVAKSPSTPLPPSSPALNNNNNNNNNNNKRQTQQQQQQQDKPPLTPTTPTPTPVTLPLLSVFTNPLAFAAQQQQASSAETPIAALTDIPQSTTAAAAAAATVGEEHQTSGDKNNELLEQPNNNNNNNNEFAKEQQSGEEENAVNEDEEEDEVDDDEAPTSSDMDDDDDHDHDDDDDEDDEDGDGEMGIVGDQRPTGSGLSGMAAGGGGGGGSVTPRTRRMLSSNQMSRYINYRTSLTSSVRGSLLEYSVPEEHDRIEDALSLNNNNNEAAAAAPGGGGDDTTSTAAIKRLQQQKHQQRLRRKQMALAAATAAASGTAVPTNATTTSNNKTPATVCSPNRSRRQTGTTTTTSASSHHHHVVRPLSTVVTNGNKQQQQATANNSDKEKANVGFNAPTLANLRRFISIMEAHGFFNVPLNLESVDFNLRNSLVKKCSDNYRRTHRRLSPFANAAAIAKPPTTNNNNNNAKSSLHRQQHQYHRQFSSNSGKYVAGQHMSGIGGGVGGGMDKTGPVTLFLDYLDYLTSMRLFQNTLLFVLAVSFAFNVIGVYVPLLYACQYGVSHGLVKAQAIHIVCLVGLMSAAGRLVATLGYKVCASTAKSRIFAYVCALFLCAATLASATFLCDTYLSFVVFALVFGSLVGFSWSLRSLVIYDIVGLEWSDDSLAFHLVVFQALGLFVGIPFAGISNAKETN